LGLVPVLPVSLVALADALTEAATPGIGNDAPSRATSDTGSTGTSPNRLGIAFSDVDKAPSFAGQKQGMVDALPKCVGDGAGGAPSAQVVPPPRRCTILSADSAQRRDSRIRPTSVAARPRTANDRAHHRPRPFARRDRAAPEDCTT
jgi:hypothetical protein